MNHLIRRKMYCARFELTTPDDIGRCPNHCTMEDYQFGETFFLFIHKLYYNKFEQGQNRVKATSLPVCQQCKHTKSSSSVVPVADSEGAEGTFAPPPPKSAKKRKSVLFSPFPNIWLLKMQKFLCSLRSPVLFNIILNIALLKNLENNTCSYILSSFYIPSDMEM